MKKIYILLVPIMIAALCLSSCSRRFGYGKAAAPPQSISAPPISYKIATPFVPATRTAVLESHFEVIGGSADVEELSGSIIEVLEMCENDRTVVELYSDSICSENLILGVTIREYIDLLTGSEYEDRIVDISYNDNGKVTSIDMVYEALVEVELEELEEIDPSGDPMQGAIIYDKVTVYEFEPDTVVGYLKMPTEMPDADEEEEVDITFGVVEDEGFDFGVDDELEELDLEAELARQEAKLARQEAKLKKLEEAESELRLEIPVIAPKPPPPPPPAAAAAPQPSPTGAQKLVSMPSASRYAPIENSFKTIAASEDMEEVLNRTIEVLEMCESEETKVIVVHIDAEKIVIDTTIRVYLEIINKAQVYEDEISNVRYNNDGKIVQLELIRY